VRFNIFLCFFLRIRLRRFLMSDPMAGRTLAELHAGSPVGWCTRWATGRSPLACQSPGAAPSGRRVLLLL
jgi:hypothetical protein